MRNVRLNREFLVVFILTGILVFAAFLFVPQNCRAETALTNAHQDEFSEYDEKVEGSLDDPLEIFNRAIFTFNDRLHRWVVEPTARGYRKVTPSMFRTGLLNFFNNLLEPTRIINLLLQGRFKAAEETFLRFLLNTTAGVGGLMDPAGFDGMKSHERQFASTLATYGCGRGFYLVLPFFGPNDLRGTCGLAGDTLTSPLFYTLSHDPLAAVGVQASNAINRTSFQLGEYEKMLSGAIDPYVAVRDAYRQHQQKLLGR
ncbi:MAG: VacJ family lipoprotein [Deltaproteobacteria bacterium]|nr:VacJ family lipoprotein [Deltaproteobacteria bacterium]